MNTEGEKFREREREKNSVRREGIGARNYGREALYL